MGRIYINKKQIIIEEMKKIYGIEVFDWMHYIITRKNFLTFHHIQPESKGGKITIENGAPLTKRAHADLNRLEEFDYALYEDWNELFKFINATRAPLDTYYIEESKKLKAHTKKVLYKKWELLKWQQIIN